jgi:signal transduction histidine kinase
MVFRNKFWSIILQIALLPALIAGIWWYLYDKREDNYVSRVRWNIKDATSVMLAESENVQQKIRTNDTIAFANLLQSPSYPYFVFKEKELVYWSDFRFVPDYEKTIGTYQFRYLSLKTGKFLVHKRSFQHEGKNFEIFSLLTLERKYEIDNQYISSGLNTDLIPHNFGVKLSDDSSDQNRNVFAVDGTFVVSLQLTAPPPYHPVTFFIIFGFCLLLMLSYSVYTAIQLLKNQEKYEWGILLLISYLSVLRWYMVEFNLPYNLVEADLFDSKYYASSIINQSLGDLLLNLASLVLCVWFLARYFFKSATYFWLIKQKWFVQTGISTITIGAGYLLTYLPYLLFRNVYLHSQIPADISRSLDFSGLRFTVIVCFILIGLIYFFLMHFICYGIQRFYPSPRKTLLIWLSGTALFIIVTFVIGIFDYTLFLISFINFGVLLFFQLPATLYRFRYTTSLYLFLVALVCASAGAYTIFQMEQYRRNEAKTDYGLQWLAENDYEAEFLLNETVKSIAQDNFIKIKLGGVLPNTDLVEQKIRRSHLQPYFNKYSINILIFNDKGLSLKSSETVSYQDFTSSFQKDVYKTSYPAVFFDKEYARNGDVVKEYAAFAPIMNDTTLTGYVIINLKQKKLTSNNVYPELLVDKNSLKLLENQQFSFAIFRKDKPEFSSGNFNYQSRFPISLLQKPEILTEGITLNGYHHLLVRSSNFAKDAQQIVVTSPRYPLSYLFANFSFLFLILVIVTIGIIIFQGVFRRSSQETGSFSTKIQLYLNVAFFLPLLLVSLIMLSRISQANRQTLANDYIKKARSVSENIADYLDRYYEGDIPKDTLTDQLTQLASYSEADINLFDKNGSLILSDQPLIYSKNILSSFINPVALVEIAERNNKELMVEESVGNLRYNSVYVGIKGNNSERLGIVSIPFFAAQAETEKQIIEVLATIMNIFTALFIVFLLLSYFASRILTIPLQLIARKLKATSLSKDNEPLQWQSDDEIGLLVNEYNKMLVNLEASKKALAQSEKESAWREMAQQVAHEIKNPLTPMKLTLQHLQRTLLNNEIKNPILERSLNTLLEQVETLSDIASSFSSFAKMPVPKEEVFDIVQVLRQTIDLYRTNENVIITTDIPALPCYVKADDQLMGRIFTNLILNGIQSVPNSRTAELNIWLKVKNGFATIEIQDNGSGIPKSVQEKIFVPNFSTKYSGSGIGLAVAKRGVEHAGGSIWFETEEDYGTSFYIKLPLAE